MKTCTPVSYALENLFFDSETTEQVRCQMFLIEMDDNKDPDQDTFGSRDIVKSSN